MRYLTFIALICLASCVSLSFLQTLSAGTVTRTCNGLIYSQNNSGLGCSSGPDVYLFNASNLPANNLDPYVQVRKRTPNTTITEYTDSAQNYPHIALTASGDSKVHLWTELLPDKNLRYLVLTHSLDSANTIKRSITLTNNSILLVGGEDGKIYSWVPSSNNLNSGAVYSGHTSAVTRISNGRTAIATLSPASSQVFVWQNTSASAITQCQSISMGSPTAIFVSRDDKLILVGNSTGYVDVYGKTADCKYELQQTLFAHTEAVRSMTSSDSVLIYTLGNNLRLWQYNETSKQYVAVDNYTINGERVVSSAYHNRIAVSQRNAA